MIFNSFLVTADDNILTVFLIICTTDKINRFSYEQMNRTSCLFTV